MARTPAPSGSTRSEPPVEKTGRRLRLVLCVLTVAACGQAPRSALCPAAPENCPSSVPSYASQVSPIIQTYCVTCHSPGGQSAGFPMTTYGQISNLAIEMQGQLSSCTMPPDDTTPLPAAERTTLLDWLVCGAPDN